MKIGSAIYWERDLLGARFTGSADVLVRDERSEQELRDCVAFCGRGRPRSQ